MRREREILAKQAARAQSFRRGRTGKNHTLQIRGRESDRLTSTRRRGSSSQLATRFLVLPADDAARAASHRRRGSSRSASATRLVLPPAGDVARAPPGWQRGSCSSPWRILPARISFELVMSSRQVPSPPISFLCRSPRGQGPRSICPPLLLGCSSPLLYFFSLLLFPLLCFLSEI